MAKPSGPARAKPGHAAVTFGSGGAILPAGTDERITNYVIADDPAVASRRHRAEIGEVLRANPALAEPPPPRRRRKSRPDQGAGAGASLPNLTVNYDNHGQIMLLPGQDGRLDSGADLANLSRLDPARHDVGLYVTEVAQAAMPGQLDHGPEAPSAIRSCTCCRRSTITRTRTRRPRRRFTDQLLRISATA